MAEGDAKGAQRRCGELSGSRNKDGGLCGSYARKGKTTCMSHADEAEKAEVGFGGAENGRKGGEARRIPKLSELIRERLVEEADRIVERLFEGLDAEGAVVVGTGSDAFLDTHPDHAIRLRTIREIMDRTEGRPKSVSEFTGKIDIRNADQLDKAIERELLREVERLSEQAAERDGARDGEPDPSRA